MVTIKPKTIIFRGVEYTKSQLEKRKKELVRSLFHPWTSEETKKKHEVELEELKKVI